MNTYASAYYLSQLTVMRKLKPLIAANSLDGCMVAAFNKCLGKFKSQLRVSLLQIESQSERSAARAKPAGRRHCFVALRSIRTARVTPIAIDTDPRRPPIRCAQHCFKPSQRAPSWRQAKPVEHSHCATRRMSQCSASAGHCANRYHLSFDAPAGAIVRRAHEIESSAAKHRPSKPINLRLSAASDLLESACIRTSSASTGRLECTKVIRMG